MGATKITKWAKFIKVDFEKNGYFYFIKGINQSNVNLNSCSIFPSDVSIDYFEDLCIKKKYLISVQFWSSLIIFSFFQLLDLVLTYRKRRDRKKEVDHDKKSIIKDMGSLRYILKLFFVPGVFILNNVNFESGCVKAGIDYLNIFILVSATYQVLPYAFAFIIIAIIVSTIQFYNNVCFDCFNQSLLKVLKFASLLGLTSVLMVSVYLYWLSFAGNLISKIDSIILFLIMLLNFINVQLFKLVH